MVADALNTDGKLIDILLALPHGASRMKGFAVAINNAVDSPFFRHTKVAFAALGKFIERTACRTLGRVEDYEFR